MSAVDGEVLDSDTAPVQPAPRSWHRWRGWLVAGLAVVVGLAVAVPWLLLRRDEAGRSVVAGWRTLLGTSMVVNPETGGYQPAAYSLDDVSADLRFGAGAQRRDDGTDVYVFPTTSRETVEPITLPDRAFGARWSPAGGRLVVHIMGPDDDFAADQRRSLVVIDVAGRTHRRVDPPLAAGVGINDIFWLDESHLVLTTLRLPVTNDDDLGVAILDLDRPGTLQAVDVGGWSPAGPVRDGWLLVERHLATHRTEVGRIDLRHPAPPIPMVAVPESLSGTEDAWRPVAWPAPSRLIALGVRADPGGGPATLSTVYSIDLDAGRVSTVRAEPEPRLLLLVRAAGGLSPPARGQAF